jgi:hypothetical protein
LTGEEPPPPGAEESDTEPEQANAAVPPEPAKENGTVPEAEHITTLPEDDIMSMIEAEQPPDYVKVGLLTATK